MLNSQMGSQLYCTVYTNKRPFAGVETTRAQNTKMMKTHSLPSVIVNVWYNWNTWHFDAHLFRSAPHPRKPGQGVGEFAEWRNSRRKCKQFWQKLQKGTSSTVWTWSTVGRIVILCFTSRQWNSYLSALFVPVGPEDEETQHTGLQHQVHSQGPPVRCKHKPDQCQLWAKGEGNPKGGHPWFYICCESFSVSHKVQTIEV